MQSFFEQLRQLQISTTATGDRCTILKLSINAIKKIGIVTGISTLTLLGAIDRAHANCSPDGKVWVSGNTGQLGYYQISTNAFIPVANGQGITWGDIGWGSNNKLYGVSFANASGPNALYEINPSTGTYTQIKDLSTVGAQNSWNSLSGLPDATLLIGTDNGSSASSTIYRVNLNNVSAAPTVWHNFGSGAPGGDFVLFNDKIYVLWNTYSEYVLYEVTVDSNYNYVSHQNLGVLPNKSFGLALVLNKLYISADDKIYRIDSLPTSPVSTIPITTVSNPPYNTYGATGIEEPFGGCSPVLPADLKLVKRITEINGNRTQNPNDTSKPLDRYIDNLSTPNDDVTVNWPNNYLIGSYDAGLVNPGDVIEYTVYFINASGADATAVKICDRIIGTQQFLADAYGTGKDIEYRLGTTPNPVQYLTKASLASVDGAELNPSTSAIAGCPAPSITGTNNGTVVLDVTGNTGTGQVNITALPGATAPGTPTNFYGYFRFKVKVDP